MQKRKNKSTLPGPEYDWDRATRVLLEEVRSNYKLVAEHTGLSESMGKMALQMQGMAGEFGSFKLAVMENSRHIRELKTDVGSLKTDVSDLKEKISSVENRLERKISSVETKLDTILTDHEQRLQRLEASKLN